MPRQHARHGRAAITEPPSCWSPASSSCGTASSLSTMAAAHKPGHMGTREAHTTALWAQVGAGRAGSAGRESGKHLKQDQLVLAPRSVGNGTP